MGGRILTMQRQARELGRLRSGWTDTSGTKPRPVKSSTWVVTSHAEHYVQAAAALWGGAVERWQPLGGGAEQYRVITDRSSLDALLPPGDPLSQANELWSKGGCARRCDGVTESLSDRPCLCLAEHGDTWYEQPKGRACAPTTRLNVMLGDLPDVGVWRVETHGYYAANEIAGSVDMLLSATGGRALVPVALRIEPRQRVAQGKTKKFPVIVVEVRGMTARQALAGDVPQLAAHAPQAEQRAALDAGRPDYLAQAKQARTADEVREIWRTANAAGHMTPELSTELKQVADVLDVSTEAGESGWSADEVIVPELVEDDDQDPTELWFQIVNAAGKHGWSSGELEQRFAARYGGTLPPSATSAQLAEFLAAVKAGEVA